MTVARSTEPQPEPRGTMVDIPRVSPYFSRALGWHGESLDHGTITGRSTRG